MNDWDCGYAPAPEPEKPTNWADDPYNDWDAGYECDYDNEYEEIH